METHLGVIRDKKAIHTALMYSQSTHRQLAVCFSSDGKLLVKICSVVDIVGKKSGVSITLRSNADDPQTEITVPLHAIQSIYPIRDFLD